MRGSDVQEWRDESPFMYATPPNGRACVGVEERAVASALGVAFAKEPEDDRTGCGARGTGATGACGWGWATGEWMLGGG